jgi:sugar O-acyltransferase (sialic acid O-acetyltransferase NeuD family)
MREILFWGATGQASVLYEAIQGTDLKLVALADNRKMEPGKLGLPVMHGEKELIEWLSRRADAELYFAVAVGGARGAQRIELMDILLRHRLKAVSVVHRTAFVASSASIGEGCQILAQSAVCAFARLGRGVIINTAASVDHDCELGDGVHLGPGARLAGEVTVNAGAFIGTGAVVLPRIRIGEGAVVGAGAVVTRNVPVGATVVGNPARVYLKK